MGAIRRPMTSARSRTPLAPRLKLCVEGSDNRSCKPLRPATQAL
jgi:hypothetical protein